MTTDIIVFFEISLSDDHDVGREKCRAIETQQLKSIGLREGQASL